MYCIRILFLYLHICIYILLGRTNKHFPVLLNGNPIWWKNVSNPINPGVKVSKLNGCKIWILNWTTIRLYDECPFFVLTHHLK